MEWIKLVSFICLFLALLGWAIKALKNILTGSSNAIKKKWKFLNSAYEFVNELLEHIPVIGDEIKNANRQRLKNPNKTVVVENKNKLSSLIQLIACLIFMCIASYLLCKPACHYIAYELIYLFIFGKIILPLIWISPLLVLAFLQVKRLTGPRANVGMSLMTLFTAIGILICFLFTASYLRSYSLAKKFTPKVIETFPIQDPKQDRDTPFEVVVTSMQNQVKKANFEILPDNVHQTRINGHFGWAGLITAHSSILRWGSSPGIVTFDDGPTMPQHGRAQAVDFSNIPYAPQRFLFSDIYWRLKSERMWGDFDEVFLVQLNDGEHQGWYFAAPFILQKLRFPGILVPEWGGVVFVEVSTGKFFEKTADELKNNTAYTGLNLFPSTLAKLYVEVRNYDAPGGLLSDIWQWIFNTENEIQESQYDAYNQQPSIYPAINNETFYQFSVEPKGRGAKVLKESHFVNTSTGEYTKFIVESGTINPDTACKVVRETLNNHRWGEYKRNEDEPWNMAGTSKESKSLTLEPLPRSVNGKSIFYRVFVTSTSFTGSENAERVFVDGITKQTSIYNRRADYLELLNAHISPITNGSEPEEKVSKNSSKSQSDFEKLLLEVKNTLEKSNQTTEEMKEFINAQKEVIKAQNELLKELTKPSEPPTSIN